ncbi:MAG TPA: hypothetical protein VNC78_01915 [Actinomycetota bacterium]|nr:hypothetical protein [Actinomycetota bacterium]
MKVRLLVIAGLVSATSALGVGAAAPAHAGLWCENVDTVDEAADTGGAAGGACRAAIGAVCRIVTKGGGGCLD